MPAGVEGETYELLSTTSTLLNIQMVRRGYLTGEDGTRYLLPQYNGTATWIGAVGVLHSGAEVVISKSEQEAASGKPPLALVPTLCSALYPEISLGSHPRLCLQNLAGNPPKNQFGKSTLKKQPKICACENPMCVETREDHHFKHFLLVVY